MCGPSRSAMSPKSRTRRSVASKVEGMGDQLADFDGLTKGLPSHCRSHNSTVASVGQGSKGALNSTVLK